MKIRDTAQNKPDSTLTYFKNNKNCTLFKGSVHGSVHSLERLGREVWLLSWPVIAEDAKMDDSTLIRHLYAAEAGKTEISRLRFAEDGSESQCSVLYVGVGHSGGWSRDGLVLRG